MALAKLRKKVSAELYNKVRLKKVGQTFDREEMYNILTKEMELKKSYYLIKVMVGAGLLGETNSGKFYFPDNKPATQPLLEQVMEFVRKEEKPKKTSDFDEKKAVKLLLSLKNEDGSAKYLIKKYIPASYEQLQ